VVQTPPSLFAAVSYPGNSPVQTLSNLDGVSRYNEPIREVSMTQTIDPVEPALLIEANTIVSKNGGKGDSTVILVGHFHKRLKPEQILAIQYRMMALSNVVKDGTNTAWVISKDGQDYKLVNEALFRAAAMTPLSIDEDQTISTLAFDRDAFLNNALSETDIDGNA
jgi:hypothetical protein